MKASPGNIVGRLFMRTALGRRAFLAGDLYMHLRRKGWLLSAAKGMPLDARGKALPWYTYAVIAVLNDRVRPSMSVFEWGSGNSTLWWAERVAHVTSCEHDRSWHERVKAMAPDNVECLYRPLPYSDTAEEFGPVFDCVVIDGKERIQCARSSLGMLKDDGVVIWDNSYRVRDAEGFAFLTERGFHRLDFWGLAPFAGLDSCTSVFYHDRNCLGL